MDLHRLSHIRDEKAPFSPLRDDIMRGVKRSHCPFGCPLERCNEHGYCRHLVGFTRPGTKRLFDKLVPRRDVGWIVSGKDAEKVLDGTHVLVEITPEYYRVYTKEGRPKVKREECPKLLQGGPRPNAATGELDPWEHDEFDFDKLTDEEMDAATAP